jgi:hypothetical protein
MRGRLQGQVIRLVEDVPLIAFDVESMLAGAGARTL